MIAVLETRRLISSESYTSIKKMSVFVCKEEASMARSLTDFSLSPNDCDVTCVIVENKEIHCRTDILIENSFYFKTLFSFQNRVQNQSKTNQVKLMGGINFESTRVILSGMMNSILPQEKLLPDCLIFKQIGVSLESKKFQSSYDIRTISICLKPIYLSMLRIVPVCLMSVCLGQGPGLTCTVLLTLPPTQPPGLLIPLNKPCRAH